MPKKVLISGGGTGGHIFPALAIANALRRRDPSTEILFVGAEGRMEMERVPAAGYDIIGLPVSGFDRKHLLRNIKVLWRLWKSRNKARRIIKDFKPDIAVGVGGYASGPVLMIAQERHIPTLIQEQNSYPGVTNKHLAKDADRVCVAYDGMERFFPADKIIVTGNPVRDTVVNCTVSQAEAKRRLGFSSDQMLVVSVGGSLGARTINESIKRALPHIEKSGYQLLWQTGKFYADDCTKAAKGYKNVIATPFVNNMDLAYRAADLVISRAGASTISELQILGKPAILIPSPNVAEDHQRKNASALAERDAAVMILDADCDMQLATTVHSLLAEDRQLEELSVNIKKMALPGADDKIVDEIYRILDKKSQK